MYAWLEYSYESYYQESIKHHEQREQYWLAQGKPDYAAGSARKAAKWRQKQRESDFFTNGYFPKSQLGELLDRKLKQIEDKLVSEFSTQLY